MHILIRPVRRLRAPKVRLLQNGYLLQNSVRPVRPYFQRYYNLIDRKLHYSTNSLRSRIFWASDHRTGCTKLCTPPILIILKIWGVNGSYFCSRNKNNSSCTNRNGSKLVLISAYFGLLSAYFYLLCLLSAYFGVFWVNSTYFYSGSYFSPQKYTQNKNQMYWRVCVLYFGGKLKVYSPLFKWSVVYSKHFEPKLDKIGGVQHLWWTQGKIKNPHDLFFPCLKKSWRNNNSESRSGRNDKHSCQLLYVGQTLKKAC